MDRAVIVDNLRKIGWELERYSPSLMSSYTPYDVSVCLPGDEENVFSIRGQFPGRNNIVEDRFKKPSIVDGNTERVILEAGNCAVARVISIADYLCKQDWNNFTGLLGVTGYINVGAEFKGAAAVMQNIAATFTNILGPAAVQGCTFTDQATKGLERNAIIALSAMIRVRE